MTTRQNGWVFKIATGVIIGVFLFILKSQWDATEAMERRLADHTVEAARLYVPREEFVRVLNRLEDTIKEALQDAKGSGR